MKKNKWYQKKINLNINLNDWIIQFHKKVTNFFICLAQQTAKPQEKLIPP